MRQKSEQIGDEQPLCEMGGILGLQRYDSKHRIDDHEQQIGEYLAPFSSISLIRKQRQPSSKRSSIFKI